MLRWSFAFLVLALIAALLGFTNIAAGAAGIARILFAVFLAVWLFMFIGGFLVVKRR